MQKIENVLDERGSKYGRYDYNVNTQVQLMLVLEKTPSWHKADTVTREGVRMICHKLARAFNGDPSYKDNYIDIAGYAQLITKFAESQ